MIIVSKTFEILFCEAKNGSLHKGLFIYYVINRGGEGVSQNISNDNHGVSGVSQNITDNENERGVCQNVADNEGGQPNQRKKPLLADFVPILCTACNCPKYI